MGGFLFGGIWGLIFVGNYRKYESGKIGLATLIFNVTIRFVFVVGVLLAIPFALVVSLESCSTDMNKAQFEQQQAAKPFVDFYKD